MKHISYLKLVFQFALKFQYFANGKSTNKMYNLTKNLSAQ